MGQELQQTVGWWRRFDKYELRDGCIVPGKGAALILYDPWEAYRASRRGTTVEQRQPPYQSLIALVDSIKVLPDLTPTGVSLDEAARDAILEWCAKHGLLGLLLSLTQTVVLNPRILHGRGAPEGPVSAVAHRTGAGWNLRYPQVADDLARDLGDMEVAFAAGTPLGPANWGSENNRPHIVRFRSLVDTSLIDDPLDRSWARYHDQSSIV